MTVGTLGSSWVVQIDGVPLNPLVQDRVESVVVDLHETLPSMAVITMRDNEGDALLLCGVMPGSFISVEGVAQLGVAPTPLFLGEVTSLESDFSQAGTRTTIRAYSQLQRLCRMKRTRTFLEMTDDEIVMMVIAQAGIPPSIIEPTPTFYEHVGQINQTDWDFLRGRARQIGFECGMDLEGFFFRPVGSAGLAVPHPLQMGKDLIEFRPRVTAAGQVEEVQVNSWDYRIKAPIIGVAPTADVLSNVDVDLPIALLGTAVGPGTHAIVNQPFASEEEAELAAQAQATRLSNVHAEAEGLTIGNPLLVPGAEVDVLASYPYTGLYVLTRTRHIWDRRAYRTAFEVSGAHDRTLLGLTSVGSTSGPDRGAPVMNGVVIALVVEVEDPEMMGRVKLMYPWADPDYVTDWVRVAQLGAGFERGCLFYPEMDDEVLVAFEHGDTRRPYVIGQLYNGIDQPGLPWETAIEAGTVAQRGMVSKVGHRFIFNDNPEAPGIMISTSDEALTINMLEEESIITISSTGEVTIMGAEQVTVTGATITVAADEELSLTSGGVITISAAEDVSIEAGSATVTTGEDLSLTSGGALTVTGDVIMLN